MKTDGSLPSCLGPVAEKKTKLCHPSQTVKLGGLTVTLRTECWLSVGPRYKKDAARRRLGGTAEDRPLQIIRRRGQRCLYPLQYLENVIANCHKNEKQRREDETPVTVTNVQAT